LPDLAKYLVPDLTTDLTPDLIPDLFSDSAYFAAHVVHLSIWPWACLWTRL